MRISSQQIFDASVQSLQTNAADVMKYQTQIDSGQKYQNISDNVAATGLGMQLSFDAAQYTMLQSNQKLLTNNYNNLNNQLGSIYQAVAQLKQVVTQAVGVTDPNTLSTLAQKAASLRDTIKQLSDAQDASNRPIITPLTGSSQQIGSVEIEPGVFVPAGISLSEVLGRYTNSSGAAVNQDPSSGIVGNGSVSIASGTNAITGPAGSQFTAQFKAGDNLYVGGKFIGIVGSVVDDSHISLVGNYSGTSISGSPFTIVHSGSGTITANTSSPAIVGSGTQFTSQFKVGYTVFSGGQLIGTVASISDDTHITLTANAAAAGVASITSGSGNYTIGNTVDVLAVANQIVSELSSNAAPTSQDSANIDAAASQVLAANTHAGLVVTQIQNSTTAVTAKLTNIQNAQSTATGTDIAQASADLSRSQTLLQAAQSIFAKMQTTNLFDKL